MRSSWMRMMPPKNISRRGKKRESVDRILEVRESVASRGVIKLNYQRAVSLFSNCGAGDVGYRKAGFRFDVMAELDPRRLGVCLLNHPGATGVSGDLRKTWRKVVK